MDEELMGFEAEEATEGVNEQTTAEAAPEETAGEGANEQEAGEPDAEPAPADNSGNPALKQETQPPQDGYTNAQFAAARRRAEAEMQARLQAEKDNFIRETYAGQVSPYTGRPITSEAELNEYKRQLQEDQLKQAGLEPGVLREMIENDPTVKQAREMTARLKQQEGELALSREVQEIARLDPSVKSAADLMNHPNAEAFNAYVQRGYGLTDAFRLANFDSLASKKAAAARQQAMNNLTGKSHLTPTKGGAGEDVTVPADEMELFRALNPGATDKEILAFCAKNRKEK